MGLTWGYQMYYIMYIQWLLYVSTMWWGPSWCVKVFMAILGTRLFAKQLTSHTLPTSTHTLPHMYITIHIIYNHVHTQREPGYYSIIRIHKYSNRIWCGAVWWPNKVVHSRRHYNAQDVVLTIHAHNTDIHSHSSSVLIFLSGGSENKLGSGSSVTPPRAFNLILSSLRVR